MGFWELKRGFFRLQLIKTENLFQYKIAGFYIETDFNFSATIQPLYIFIGYRIWLIAIITVMPTIRYILFDFFPVVDRLNC